MNRPAQRLDERFFAYRGGSLCAEAVPFDELARRFGTPSYVYSGAAMDDAYAAIDAALETTPHLVAYAVKANGNLSILRRLGRAGCGMDIVSGGELARVLAAGVPAARILFSGVGKTDTELRAALRAGVRSIHVESAPELDALEGVAHELGARAPVALRVNPNVDSETHPYIATGLHDNKFGLELPIARSLLPRILASPHLSLVGLGCHVGSQCRSPAPIEDAVAITASFAAECARAGARLRLLDAGGGWPIRYGDEVERIHPPADFGQAIRRGVERGGAAGLNLEIAVEPGRALVGDAGVLLTRVLYVKEQAGKRFVVVDAAMTELIRPALYQAYHAVLPVTEPDPRAGRAPADLVGPVCETADFLALARPLPPLQRGDLLVIRGAGAYGASMASNYNGRPRAPEVMVEADLTQLIRSRETIEDTWRGEMCCT